MMINRNEKKEQRIRDMIVILVRERPDYGLSLQARLRKRGVVVGPSLYRTLRGMERRGILVSEGRNENPEVRDGRPRIYYKLATP